MYRPNLLAVGGPPNFRVAFNKKLNLAQGHEVVNQCTN